MKKYLKNKTWEKLPIPNDDYRPRFFVEIYQELLNSNTLASYQPRLMNLYSYIHEIIDLIKFYNQDERAKHYITKSLTELSCYLKNDESAKIIYADEISILKNEINNNALSEDDIPKLRVIMDYFLSNEKKIKYWNSICDNLFSYVCSKDFKHENIRTNLNNINSSCKLFISYLLNQGISTRYLFHRSDMFTQYSNYGSRNWEEQMLNIIKKFNIRESTYEVYFMLKTNNKLIYENKNIYNYNDFMKANKGNIRKNDNFIKFTKQKKEKGFHYIVKYNIDSSNYDNAQLKAKNKLDILLDAINVLYKIETLDNILVINKNNTKKHIHIIENFSSEKRLRFLEDDEIDLMSIFSGLDRDSVEVIKNSLRYFRLARESKSIEQKILNTWISIESLYVKNKNKNIIDDIIKYVPMIYNSFSIIRKIRYAKELLKINKVKIPNDIKETLKIKNNIFDKNTTDEQILEIINEEKLFIPLVKSIDGTEHLKYRLTIIKEFIDKDKILNSFRESEESIKNQLYRIYFMRNKISHRGHYKNINPHLLEHLTDYLMISYSALVIGFSYIQNSNRENISISDLLYSYTLKFNKVKNNISNGILKIDSIYVKKLIIETNL